MTAVVWTLLSAGVLAAGRRAARCSTLVRSDMAPLVGNVRLVEFRSEVSPRTFMLAEVIDIDPVFDHSINSGLPEPFGIQSWDSAYLMASLLEKSFQRMGGLTVTDLGCGNGLVSILCASMGAAVNALDYNEYSLALLRQGLSTYVRDHPTETLSPVSVAKFDMADETTTLPACDLLLISDMIYTKEMCGLIIGRMTEALDREASVLLTDPGRSTSPHFSAMLLESLSAHPTLHKHLGDAAFRPFVNESGKRAGSGQYIWLNKEVVRLRSFAYK